MNGPNIPGQVTYELNHDSKRNAVAMEILQLGVRLSDAQLKARYGELFEAIRKLPAKSQVNVDNVLREYLSNAIYELQKVVAKETGWELPEVRTHLAHTLRGIERIISVEEFVRKDNNQFSAKLRVNPFHGAPARVVRINDQTNAGMMRFTLENE